jgi:hypothetical protein
MTGADGSTDLQHALFGVTLEGRLHLAPISPNCYNVLDIATGQSQLTLSSQFILTPI